MRVLLIGLGRMGQRYLTVLKDLYGAKLDLYTVDPFTAGPNTATHFKSIQEVPTAGFQLAIDAHPNTGRLELLQQLLDRKIPKIIIEKPHAQSLTESNAMGELIAKSSSQVMLPFYRFFFPALQQDTLQQMDAGKLLSIHTTAGAIGFGCNGVHLLELAARLLGGDPQTVYGQLGMDTIPSPRGPQYLDHDGLMVVNYPNGRFVFSIYAKSSVGISTTFVFENGKIQLNEQTGASWTWWRRPAEHFSLPATRTSMEKEITPPLEYNLNLEKLIHTGITDFMANRPVPTFRDGHRTLKTIALAQESTRLNRVLSWSDDNMVSETQFHFT